MLSNSILTAIHEWFGIEPAEERGRIVNDEMPPAVGDLHTGEKGKRPAPEDKPSASGASGSREGIPSGDTKSAASIRV